MSIIADDAEKVKGIDEKPRKPPQQAWTERKLSAIALAQRMQKYSELRTRADRIEHCGDITVARYCPSCGKVHYMSAGMCRDRLCPLCQWRLTRGRYGEMLRCFDLLADDMRARDVHATMLTLTLKNVPVVQLAGTLKAMTLAWRECTKRVAVKKSYGWARCIEITYNRDQRTYHPHLHVMLLWARDDAAAEATAGHDCMKEWRKQLKLSYQPVWHYEKAYNKHIDKDLVKTETVYDVAHEYDSASISAAKECGKYLLKLDDLLKCPEDDIPYVARAIKGVRFVGYGGALKRARALLGLIDDEGSPDEAEHEPLCRDCGTELKNEILIWAGAGYARAEE